MSFLFYHNQFAHLRILLQEILSATNNFSSENICRQDGFGRAYKGQLLRSGELIDILALRLDRESDQGRIEFMTEVSMLSTLNHENLVSVIGFCDDDNEQIIIYRHKSHGSLDEYLSEPRNLTWMQRLEICVGVARALSYIHYDKGHDFSVIHGNIKSSKILLEDNWKPKLFGFQLSMKNTATRRHRLLLDDLKGTVGYIDPRYEKTGGVTYKSDVYSFGVVLFEVLCGRTAFNIPAERCSAHSKEESVADEILEHDQAVKQQYNNRMPEEDEIMEQPPGPVLDPLDMCTFINRSYKHLHMPEGELLAPLAILHYEERKLDSMIHPDLWKQTDPQSFNIFSETAYYCLKEQRSERPEIDQIVIRLEKALNLQQRHENRLTLNERSDVATEVEGPSTNHLEWETLEHLKIGFHDIELATENFSQTHCIGSGAYGKVYKAELKHVDGQNSSKIEGKNVCDLPKIHSTVAIKCIFKREDAQDEKGFCAEIKILTSCKHPNIVSLLGFCDEKSQMILVYEYVSRGSLDDYLRGIHNMINLKWIQRLQMCLDIAEGLNYLHNQQSIIHRDIKSDNILLDDNWVAKIADFGLSKLGPISEQVSYLETNVAGTNVYLDPEYEKTHRLKKASDIYSFGVVLFEIMSGTLAYDTKYMKENDKGLASFVRQHFQKGTLKDILDPKLKEEFDENINFTLSKGPNKDSLDTFLDIAYQCLAETQAQRPKIATVIKELKKALYFQENHTDNLKISLEDIKLATDHFSIHNFVAKGGFGAVYKGEVTNANGGHTTVAVKRLDKDSSQGKTEFLTELEILLEYKHENIIGLVGYCNEMGESIIIYEYASRGSLNKYVRDDGLTWMKRLQICIDIVTGLDFLHEDAVIHRDIKSSNILLNDEWKAKIADFGISLITPITKDMDFIIEAAAGTFGYLDPVYYHTGTLARESDVYSLGVVLFEMLCGRLAFQKDSGFLGVLAERKCKEGKLDEIVFKGIKDQIAPKSFTTFQSIAFQCLQPKREERPTTGEVLRRIKQALEFQEDYEIWEPKLPNDYKKIIPEMYNITKREKDLYDLLSKGVLLQEDQVLFSLGRNGEKNEMISAKRLSYIKHCPHIWRSVLESRFQVVAEVLDILNLKIKIKTRAKLLSQDVVYGVYLVFKFSNPKAVLGKPLYVNLKYKIGRKSSHAYFATWRDNDWMMIELCRFFNNKTDTVHKFLLESFSRYYCGDNTIFVEGVEFRAIDNVKHEDIQELNEVQQILKSDSNMDVLQLPTKHEEMVMRPKNIDNDEQLFWLREVNGKKHLTLSAKAALYDYSDVKLFKTKPSAQSRFQEVIELLLQQIFRINCKITSQMLSPDTEYACYLVFKLSDKCRGLHCPVKVRDLLHRNNKEN
ncbi:unnamed protein product [Lactuca saligna]|uniref:non-specific serine/threonine protein kinase n=1 Tax=Lactuca saligna TaxID=75948 RepID=A0AA35Y0D2_LACSI|nr:unnamed protein product [Lactuca saligna]